MTSRQLRTFFATLLLGSLAAVTYGADGRRGPFLHSPRSVRTRDFDVLHIRLELRFDWDREELRGRVTHTFRPFVPLDRIRLDAEKLQVQRVGLPDGKPLRFHLRPHELEIELGRTYKVGETVRVTIDYTVSHPRRGVHFVGGGPQGRKGRRIVWTQSQPDDARRWFPCFDSPVEKATSELIATVPPGYLVLSNGRLADCRENKDKTVTWHWKQEQPHSNYLISVVAGKFEALEQSWDGIPVVSYVAPGKLALARRSFGKTPAMVQYFSNIIGYRYPWPKYAQICCEEYGGGMEHTSCTTLTDRTLHDERAALDVSSDGLVSHELAHQWWGDLLTCKDWGELWLNESFATYFATLWTEHDKGPDEAAWARVQLAERYFKEDQQRYRRPIVTYRYEKSANMFDSHSYPKGALVLHMLRFVLGDELFWRAIKHYAHQHAFDVVETADLREAIEQATGRGLNWFFDQWLYHGGHPEYEVSYQWDERQKLVRLTVRQVQKRDELTPLFRMPVDVELVTSQGSRVRRVTVSQAEQQFSFSLAQRPGRVCFDKGNWILKKLKFEKSKQELIEQLKSDADVPCRVQAVRQLQQWRPDAEVREALERAARHDQFWAVRSEAAAALAKFTGPMVRQTLLAVATADAKSSVRRAAVRALANFPGTQTLAVLGKLLAEDRSYYVAADALSTLAKLDPAGAEKELLAALDRPSHQEVIRKAAGNALADLRVAAAKSKLLQLAQPDSPPEVRAAAFGPLARLGRGDSQVTDLLLGQLDDPRGWLRRSLFAAFGQLGDPRAIQPLLQRRDHEWRNRNLTAIEDAVARIRTASDELQQLRRRLRALEERNRRLEKRLQALQP